LRLPAPESASRAHAPRSADLVAPRPYLSAEQLAALTPWSVEAIRRMIRRDILRSGVHYFQPAGRGGQVIFKWSAIIGFIEGDARTASAMVGTRASESVQNGQIVDVDAAAEEAKRLLS
jgi:hypothetical protein